MNAGELLGIRPRAVRNRLQAGVSGRCPQSQGALPSNATKRRWP